MRNRNSVAADRSKVLRRNLTAPERIVWRQLRSRRTAHLKFRRQHPFGPYILDFYCAAYRVAIELDGDSHQDRLEHDTARTAWLASEGVTVLRIANDDVLSDEDAVLEMILRACGIDIDRRS